MEDEYYKQRIKGNDQFGQYFNLDQQIHEQSVLQSKYFVLIYLSKSYMKCVSIVYKRPTAESVISEFMPVRSVKRSVDGYIGKLQEKQQNNKNISKGEHNIFRSRVNTVQTSRIQRLTKPVEMTQSINVIKLKYSTQNIFKTQNNNFEFEQTKKERKFRSTFVKQNKQQKGVFSLKNFKIGNYQLFEEIKPHPSPRRQLQNTKNCSKLISLKKIKIVKPKIMLISVDFILNENNFWSEEKIDELAHKNWKILQEHSNIIWLTKRQNSFKKLQKYAAQFGLRLDGVYKMLPNKKSQTLLFSLSNLEKDLASQSEHIKKLEVKNELICINSLKVESIREVRYQQFYSSFPISKSMKCIVHFIQMDMNDKQRFNLPLRILSKEKLPTPNQVNHLFKLFEKDHSKNPKENMQTYYEDIYSVDNQLEYITKDEMMQKYEQVKDKFVNYFGSHLKLNLNNKIKTQDAEISLQYLIGDMLRRNFSLMHNYQKQCMKIRQKLQNIRNKVNHKNENATKNIPNETDLKKDKSGKHKIRITFDQLLNSKLTGKANEFAKDSSQQETDYKNPVFLWKT